MDNKGPRSLRKKHDVEFGDTQDGSQGHYYGKPGGTKPDDNEEDRDEDYCT